METARERERESSETVRERESPWKPQERERVLGNRILGNSEKERESLETAREREWCRFTKICMRHWTI